MGRVSAAGMREHLRERNNMDGGSRVPGKDVGCCDRRHELLDSRYCPDCGKEVNG